MPHLQTVRLDLLPASARLTDHPAEADWGFYYIARRRAPGARLLLGAGKPQVRWKAVGMSCYTGNCFQRSNCFQRN